MDLSPYMTAGADLERRRFPALVDKLADLLTGGQMTPEAKTAIVNFTANTTNFPFNADAHQHADARSRPRRRSPHRHLAGIRRSRNSHGTGTLFLVHDPPEVHPPGRLRRARHRRADQHDSRSALHQCGDGAGADRRLQGARLHLPLTAATTRTTSSFRPSRRNTPATRPSARRSSRFRTPMAARRPRSR